MGYEAPHMNTNMLGFGDEKERIQDLIDDQISELDKLKKALANENDGERAKMLQEQIDAEEKRLAEIKKEYDNSQDQFQQQLENQRETQKDRLRKRREALRIKKNQMKLAEENMREKELEMQGKIDKMKQEVLLSEDAAEKDKINQKLRNWK